MASIRNAPAKAKASAIMSPRGILLAGLGAAVAILGGAGLPAGLGIGACLWGANGLLSLRKYLHLGGIDPFAVGDPWRTLMIHAQQAQRRFDATLKKTKSPGLRERLSLMQNKIQEGVSSAWEVARRGDELQAAVSALRAERVEEKLARLDQELQSNPSREELVAARESVQRQLDSQNRLSERVQETHDKLTLLGAHLDESVTKSIELSVTGSDAAELSGVQDDLDNLVVELEALRQATAEVSAIARSAGQ